MTNNARFLPWVVVGCAALYLIMTMMPPAEDDRYMHFYEFGTIPVQDGGRIKPLDTMARNDLMLLSHRQTFVDLQDHSQPAVKWLLATMLSDHDPKSEANNYRVFRIENDQLRNVMRLEARPGLRYSVNDMRDGSTELDKENALVEEKEGKQLNLFEQKVADLNRQMRTYQQVALMQGFNIVPGETASDGWEEFIKAFQKSRNVQQRDSYALLFADIVAAYNKDNVEVFNKAVADYQERITAEHPAEAGKARFEAWFNHAEPFYHCLILYIGVFVLVLLGWLGIPLPLNRAAFWLALLTLSIHVLGLIGRMYITERPFVFVTNLYSSAVFIGSLAVGLGLILERLFPLGIGNCLASLLGFATLLIAHNLAASGDTMAVLLPVLDTNFWLATHVTLVTFGYASTYVAGALGLIFVAFQLRMVVLRYFDGARDRPTVALTFTFGLPFLLFRQLSRALVPVLAGTPLEIQRNGTVAHNNAALAMVPGGIGGREVVHAYESGFRLDQDMIRLLGRLIYGIVCFATLLSFVGTVLGGIWADQSWGRFWGWDPKENGALIIVIWNALILHARWGGMVQQRGMAALALVGNIVTTWSWFGVNMLGVGLHSYGFMEGAAFWVFTFVGFNLAMMGVCLMPSYLWRDTAAAKPQVPPPQLRPSKGHKSKRHAPAGAIQPAAAPIMR